MYASQPLREAAYPGHAPLDVSVLIATHNRAKLLGDTLAHLGRQQRVTDFRWEVVVVDNGSSDETESVLREAGEALPLIPLREELPGKSRALNRALDVARGELIVFTDDDVVPTPGWLAALHDAAQRWPDQSVFGGAIVPLYPDGTPQWLAEHPFTLNAFGQFDPPQSEGPLPGLVTPFGANFAVRSHIIQQYRFNENLGPQGQRYAMGEESELLRKLRLAGELIIYVPAARLQHVVRPDQLEMAWLLRKAYQAGRAHVLIMPDLESPRIFRAPRWLWRVVAQAYVRRAMRSWSGVAARFDADVELHGVRGQLYEYRHAPAPRAADAETVQPAVRPMPRISSPRRRR